MGALRRGRLRRFGCLDLPVAFRPMMKLLAPPSRGKGRHDRSCTCVSPLWARTFHSDRRPRARTQNCRSSKSAPTLWDAGATALLLRDRPEWCDWHDADPRRSLRSGGGDRVQCQCPNCEERVGELPTLRDVTPRLPLIQCRAGSRDRRSQHRGPVGATTERRVRFDHQRISKSLSAGPCGE